MQIFLQHRAASSLDLRVGDRLRLSTRKGTGWVTQEGAGEDLVLSPSHSLTFTGPGRVVIEALDDSMCVRADHLPLAPPKEALLVTG